MMSRIGTLMSVMLVVSAALTEQEVCQAGQEECVQGSSMLSKEMKKTPGPAVKPAAVLLQDKDSEVAALREKLTKQKHMSALQTSHPDVPPPPPLSPDALTGIADKMKTGMKTQDGFSADMYEQQKLQLAEHKAQKAKGLRAGVAEDAHVSASDALGEASDEATKAAEARDAANKAVDSMRAAKAALLDMQDKETKQANAESLQQRRLKEKQVEFETASLKAEQARQASAVAESAAASARADKTVADQAETMADKAKAAATEKETRMLAEQDEKETQLKLCNVQKAKLEAALAKAEEELDTITSVLGVKEAEKAKLDVQEEIAAKNRQMMRKQYDTKQMLAHSLEETAFHAESRATAAAEHSRAMASLAKSQADEVVVSGVSGPAAVS